MLPGTKDVKNIGNHPATILTQDTNGADEGQHHPLRPPVHLPAQVPLSICQSIIKTVNNLPRITNIRDNNIMLVITQTARHATWLITPVTGELDLGQPTRLQQQQGGAHRHRQHAGVQGHTGALSLSVKYCKTLRSLCVSEIVSILFTG